MSGSPPTRKMLQTLEAVRTGGGASGFDAEAWHVMDQRDNALIADELLNGSGSSKFVYQFSVSGTAVAGVSVVGARHLASAYGGIKHRLVASVQKTGALFTFQSFPAPEMPMSVHCQSIPELEDEEDFYGVIVEVTDIKRGVTVQMEKRENRFEVKKNGERYERAHYATIAQSKAYRNGVLALIPQDTQMRWKLEQMKLGKDDVLTNNLMEEKRANVLRFAASKGLTVERSAVERLTMDQIAGLSDAARLGPEDFLSSARGLALTVGSQEPGTTQTSTSPAAAASGRAPAQAGTRHAGQTQQQPSAPPRETQQQSGTAPRQESTRQPAPDWIGYLCDEFGNMVGDPYTTGISYARALGAMWEKLPGPDERRALMEHNDEWIVQVLEMGGDAAAVIRDLTKLTPPQDDQQANQVSSQADPGRILPVELGIQARGGAPAWPPYVKALKESLGRIGADRLAEWAAANIETIRKAPNLQRLNIVKAVNDHVAAVGGAVPAIIQELAEPSSPPSGGADQPDRDAAWVESTIQDMSAFTLLRELDTLVGGTIYQSKMNRFRSDREDLAKQLQVAEDARRSELDFPGDRP